jgi:hypothetical protein
VYLSNNSTKYTQFISSIIISWNTFFMKGLSIHFFWIRKNQKFFRSKYSKYLSKVRNTLLSIFVIQFSFFYRDHVTIYSELLSKYLIEFHDGIVIYQLFMIFLKEHLLIFIINLNILLLTKFSVHLLIYSFNNQCKIIIATNNDDHYMSWAHGQKRITFLFYFYFLI